MHISSYEICLERVAEEFMGRRKWKHYQEQRTRSQLNIAEQQPIAPIIEEQQQQEQQSATGKYNNNNNNNCNKRLQETQPKEIEQLYNGALQFESDFDNNRTSREPSATAIGTTSRTPSPPPEPNDWTPSDKCNFCVNGRLLTVNAKGELVAETAAPTNYSNNFSYNGDAAQQLDSDSNSSASLHNYSGSSNNIKQRPNKRTTSATHDNPNNASRTSIELYRLLTQQAATMTSMDSMAAQLAAIQTISEFQTNYNLINSLANQQQQQQQQQQHTSSVTPTTSEVSAAAISPTLKDTPSPSADAPLDLSSKPSPNSSISGDLKSIRTISECATPVPSARRTYSEEDLSSALQDVMSHKLGTRKAASQYNVPRSTLRNKVYKMTLEAKRQNAQTPPELLQLKQELELEQDESGDDDSNASTPAPPVAFHEFAQRLAATAQRRKLSAMSENNNSDVGEDSEQPAS